MKLLIWKAYHNALPGNECLVARQITTNQKCALCDGNESIVHLFFNCPVAQEVWRKFPSKEEISMEQITTFAEGWRRVLRMVCLPPNRNGFREHDSVDSLEYLANSNQIIFKETGCSSQEIVSKAIRMAKEWIQAQQETDHQSKTRGPRRVGPRPETMCKADAAWHREKKIAGVAREFIGRRAEL